MNWMAGVSRKARSQSISWLEMFWYAVTESLLTVGFNPEKIS